MTRARFTALALLAVLAAAAASWLLVNLAGRDRAPEAAVVLPEPRALAAFELVDHRGNAVTKATLAGSWHLLFFGFANCPDICPATLGQLAAARRRLAAEHPEEVPRILFVSVDPGRDTQQVLADYAGRFGDGVLAATAEPEVLKRLADDLGIFFRVQPGADDGYEVSHSAAVLLLNPRAELQAVFSAPHRTDAFVDDLPIVMAMR